MDSLKYSFTQPRSLKEILDELDIFKYDCYSELHSERNMSVKKQKQLKV